MLTIRQLLLVAVLSVTAHAGEIVLQERCVPYHTVVRLGDVAEVRDVPMQLHQQLTNTPIMPAPAPGEEQFVRAQTIRDLLAAHGMRVDDFTFSGADAVQVLSVQTAIAPPEQSEQRTGFRAYKAPSANTTVLQTRVLPLGRAVEDRIRGEISAAIDAVVRAVPEGEFLQTIEVGAGEALMRAWLQATEKPAIMPSAPIAAGARTFRLVFTTPNGPQEFTLLAELAETRPVLTATRPLLRGDVITMADFVLAPAPLEKTQNAQARFFADPNEVLGQEAARSIRPGDLLTDQNCTPPLVIRRGELITVISGGDGIIIRLAAKADRDGRQGDLIPVRTLDRNEILMGRVTGRGEVAVLSAAPSTNQAVARDLRKSTFR
jgi:flagella basal body P-ring formation protein FlgA